MANQAIPEWIYSCLDQYSNCACGRAIVKKMGKDGLLKALADDGYNCELEVLADPKDTSEFPKDGTYILTVKSSKEAAKDIKD